MNLLSLYDHMVQLSNYVTKSQRRQQLGLPVDEELLQDAERILRRLSMIASIPPAPESKTHS